MPTREGVGLNVLRIDDFQRRQSLRHADRISAERIEMNAICERRRNFRPGDHRAKRRAVADALGHRDHVGNNIPVFKRPELRARPAKSALNFIRHANPAGLADDVVDDLEIFLRRRHHSAHALNAFADEDRDFAAGFVLDQIFYVRARISNRTMDTSIHTGTDNNIPAWHFSR